ncbi:MAG: type II secretion system protein GspG [Candidatus Omnitrophota bacterium]
MIDKKTILKKGFTLIELLVVIMIIMALAGLVVGGAQKARQRALVAKAKAAIASLETGLSMYELDYGYYPDAPISNVVTLLSKDPGEEDDTWNGPYVMFKEEDLKDGNLIDPWGNPYEYANPGSAEHGHDRYIDIWSKGPDGTDGGGDDIINW